MGKSNYKYDQEDKRMVRHNIISHSVKILTQDRETSTCVHRDYVRKVYDYFVNTRDETPNKDETRRIERNHIISWENLHDTYTSIKQVKDLVVCYLCGPEPNNDFDELISLGVLPQNIWAF